MQKKDWKKVFNLNTYEWWRNHRRVVTFALLLFAFGAYVRYPSAELLRIKKYCGEWFSFRDTETYSKKLKLKNSYVAVENYCAWFK